MIPIIPQSSSLSDTSSLVVPLFNRPGAIQITTQLPLSLYIHWPWCVRKCPYCDFNSHENKESASEDRYIDALITDLELALPLIWGRRIHTIFLGGGTPSLISATGLDRLLGAVRARVTVDANAEITLEANPGTFELERFLGFKAAGINRLSLGIQSFNTAHLKALGRIHDAQEAQAAAQFAIETFENCNLDLMFALPGQTFEQCAHDVTKALSFASPHISLYHLTIEPNTYFHRHPPEIPDDDLAFAMQDMIGERLDQAGYQHYEVSAYAKPGRQAQHNLNYWQFGDYLGIGAGAHSKLSFPHRIVRQMRFKQPQAYLSAINQQQPVQEEFEVSTADLPFEFMLNTLRLTNGFATTDWCERTGLPFSAIQKQLDEAEKRGLISRNHQKVVPTIQGQRFLNDLQMLFLRE